MLFRSLKHFDKRLASRISWAKRYQADLKKLNVNVILPPDGYTENGYCNVTLFENSKRTAIETILKEKGIGFGNIYPGAMSDQEGSKEFLQKKFSTGIATRISSTVLNFPLFPYMREEEYAEIHSIIANFQSGKN